MIEYKFTRTCSQISPVTLATLTHSNRGIDPVESVYTGRRPTLSSAIGGDGVRTRGKTWAAWPAERGGRPEGGASGSSWGDRAGLSWVACELDCHRSHWLINEAGASLGLEHDHGNSDYDGN